MTLKEEWLDQKQLQIGKVYVAHYSTSSMYLLLAVDSKLTSCPYINDHKYRPDGNFEGSFTGSIFKEATKLEELTLRNSIKEHKYSPVFMGEYKITASNGEYYVAASELNDKIEWTEECKDIVKYIKDDTCVFLFGAVTKKPKTFKELKEIVCQENQ